MAKLFRKNKHTRDWYSLEPTDNDVIGNMALAHVYRQEGESAWQISFFWLEYSIHSKPTLEEAQAFALEQVGKLRDVLNSFGELPAPSKAKVGKQSRRRTK